jgi:hypothetical protein
MQTAKPRTKATTNLNLPCVVKTVADSWAKANGRDLSDLVGELLRNFLQSKSVPCEADLFTIIELLKKRAGDTNKAKLSIAKGAKALKKKQVERETLDLNQAAG